MQSTAVNGLTQSHAGLQGLDGSQSELSALAAGEMNPESIIEMLKEQLSPEAAMLLDLLIQMLKGGQNPFEPEPPAGGHAPAGAAPAGGAHEAGGASMGGHEGAAAGAAGAASPVGEGVDGAGGFLWKPQSESDGNLVVLLPPELQGKVEGVRIEDGAGNILDEGRFAGDQKNGGRPHFRFDQPGGNYGDGLKVVATTSDGQELSFDVGNGAERHD